MNLKEKILNICKTYSTKYDAKLWLLGTNVYHSISCFIQNLKSHFSYNELDLLKELSIVDMGFKEVRYKSSTQLQKRYGLFVNNKNVTPITNGKNQASFGAIRQYLNELISINFINGSENTRLHGNEKFDILPDLKYCIQSNENVDDNIIRKFISLIKNKGFNEYSSRFEKNLGYSLFLSLLYLYDETRPIISEINVEHLKPITIRSSIYKKNNNLEKVKHLLNFKKQYFELCQKLKNHIGAFSNFEQIILDEMLGINIDNSNNVELSNMDSSINYPQLKKIIEIGKKQIENYRNKLIKNIRQNRGYDNDIDLYTDFDNFPGRKICNYHPCHIFEVRNIKKEYENEMIKLYGNKKITNSTDYEELNVKYQSFASDPANGLLMTRDAHNWFDRYKFGFDFTNGQIWIKKDYDKIVAEAWNLTKDQIHNLKIKNEIFNNDMKEFLKRRAAN